MAATFHAFDTPIECATALAKAVAQDLRATLAKQPRATLAVSGGRSPVSFFQILSRADLDWGSVDIILVDERVIPTGHADSNTALVRQNLLQNRAAAARWIPLIEDDAADLQPERTVRAASAHYRRPDVLVLGMGADGHTASLFPQSPQLAAAMSPDCAQPLMYTEPVTAPHGRISLTAAEIARVPHLYLAIGGAEKKAVYERAIGKPETYPVGKVLQMAGECGVYYAD